MDIYFVSNQLEHRRTIGVSLRATTDNVELWDAVSGEIVSTHFSTADGRTELTLELPKSGSIFVILRREQIERASRGGQLTVSAGKRVALELDQPWRLELPDAGGVLDNQRLVDLSEHPSPKIRSFSGTAIYQTEFEWNESIGLAWLDLGEVANLAEVHLNGKSCGVTWTDPHRVEIGGSLQSGSNVLQIRLTNTFANQLVHESTLPEDERWSWTNARMPPADAQLEPSGLLGPVVILTPK